LKNGKKQKNHNFDTYNNRPQLSSVKVVRRSDKVSQKVLTNLVFNV
jgi:hypothetical protein